MESEIVRKLKGEILALQGIQQMGCERGGDVGLGPVSRAFPAGVFPVGIHEFMSSSSESAAATSGFMAGLLGRVVGEGQTCLWISSAQTVFPSGLCFFGVKAERIIFVESKKPADLSWMIEQALKCESLGAVVGEIPDLDLAQSRRLQLAAERSRVNCFLHRHNARVASAIASVCRWRIQSLASVLPGGMPGVGFPAWNVTLEKVRSGVPGSWQLQWRGDHFETMPLSEMDNDRHWRRLPRPVSSQTAT